MRLLARIYRTRRFPGRRATHLYRNRPTPGTLCIRLRARACVINRLKRARSHSRPRRRWRHLYAGQLNRKRVNTRQRDERGAVVASETRDDGDTDNERRARARRCRLRAATENRRRTNTDVLCRACVCAIVYRGDWKKRENR